MASLAEDAVRGVHPTTTPVLPAPEPTPLDDWQRLAADLAPSSTTLIRAWADQQLREAQDRMRAKLRLLGYDTDWIQLPLPLWLERILDRTLAERDG